MRLPGRDVARYQATPPRTRLSVTRSATESKNAPRGRRGARGLGHGAVEQVGQGGGDEQHDAQHQPAGADGDGCRRRQHEARAGEVVGADAGATEARADGLEAPFDARPPASVEHRYSLLDAGCRCVYVVVCRLLHATGHPTNLATSVHPSRALPREHGPRT